MAKASEQFRQSDVTFWAIAALTVWAIALLGGIVSATVPDAILRGLHTSRLDNASVTELSRTVAQLSSASARLKEENATLTQRLLLREQADTTALQRISNLENATGKVGPEQIDSTIITASTGSSAPTKASTDTGSVNVVTTPLATSIDTTEAQPLPAALQPATSDPSAFAVALGAPTSTRTASAAWTSLNGRVGTLLIGLSPLLGKIEGASAKRLIAGPLRSEAEAQALCGRVAKVGIACSTAAFVGDPIE